MTLEREEFGTTTGGDEVHRFLLENSRGLRVALINYGATLQSLRLPLNGEHREIVHGYDTLSGYEGKHPYFGATVGRVANRIGGAAFELGGKRYELTANDNGNTLHGGAVGYSRRVWSAEVTGTDNEASVRFTLISPDGEEGFPGRVDVSVTITLAETDELRIDYEAECNAPTPINLTNHAYWNLRGESAPDILDHLVSLEADYYLPTNEQLIPTGEIASVDGTPFDFRTPTQVGEQLERRRAGIDNNYVIRGAVSVDEGVTPPSATRIAAELRPAASVSLPDEDVVMEVESTSPGVQFYTGNMLPGTRARDGRELGRHAALCLETQHFPNALNQPNFPSMILKPGETFAHSTVHRFRY